MNNDEEAETIHTWSTSLRSKRKGAIHDNIHEYQIRTQTRRMNKH
jgi:hypothetical protein